MLVVIFTTIIFTSCAMTEQERITLGREQPYVGLEFSKTHQVILENVFLHEVFVEGGSFTMGGTPDRYPHNNELPQHTVSVDDFFIEKYEVTQKMYLAVMGYNPYVEPLRGNPYTKLNSPTRQLGENNPVICVSWIEAIEFCNKLSIAKGLSPCYTVNEENTVFDIEANGYRLPTEAEWEYAARGGSKSKGFKYSGSDRSEEVAHYRKSNERYTISAVGEFAPNELGIFDMSGNISEMCWDTFEKNKQNNSTTPVLCKNIKEQIVSKGGDYTAHKKMGEYSLQPGYRRAIFLTSYSLSQGFRICRSDTN